MRQGWTSALGILLLAASAGIAGEPPAPQSGRDKINYVVGVDLARMFRKLRIDVDPDLIVKGIRDGLSGERLPLSEKEVRQILQQFQGDVRRATVLEIRTASVENKKEGEAFLAANKAKEGVVTLPSGVQYVILKAGDGRRPADPDTVVCNYRGTTLDGIEFDASEPGKPVDVKVAWLIPGWKEAIKLMPVGSEWRIFIPSQLAYGEKPRGNEIVGPNETVILDVELLAIR